MVKRFETAPELVESAFTTYPNHQAYTCLGHTLTYKEVDELSAQFAYYLQENLGMQRGERIAFQLPNILQYPIVLYGAIRAGLVIVNINPLYTPREVEHHLKDSQAKTLMVLANIAHNSAEIIENTAVKHVIVTQLADLHPILKRTLINSVVKYVKKMVPPFSFEKAIAFRETVTHGKTAFKTPELKSEDLLILQYTGGTTGVAKGAMLSHKNLIWNVWQGVTHLPDAFKPGSETFVACLPLYHIYAFNLHALAAFSYGEHNVLIPNPRDLDAFVKDIKDRNVTVIIGINTLFTALTRHEGFKLLNFDQLKVTSSGGMSLTMDSAKSWQALTGCEVVEGYGLTETSPIVCANKIGKVDLGSIGEPVIDTDIILLDEEGKEVAKGEAGELCVKGPQVMLGYWNNEAETKKVFTDNGYLKTGDMAIRKENGNYKIVDRKKDLIIVSGFNVYPNEIEDVVSGHPDIVECAVVGMADEESGERVKVFAVKSNPNLTEAALIDYCKHDLTGYKRPKMIVFRNELPKSNVGKILRKELRD